MGDEIDLVHKPRSSKRRKTMGDDPSTIISSSFHTQTLTQLLSNQDEDEGNLLINDSEAETEADDDGALIMETPTKPREGQPPNEVVAEASEDNQPAQQEPGSQPSKLATPKRTRKTEIPSSESPAITPMLMRYSPLGKRKSPLQGRSTNVDAPSPILRSVHKRPRDLVIQDTYSTVHSSPTTAGTPTTKPTTKFGTPKKLRFELPEDKENITPGRTKPKSPKPLRKTPARPPLREVPDSDAEDDESVAAFDTEAEESESTDAPPESPTPMRRVEAPEPFYGRLDEETQAEIPSSDHLQEQDPDPDPESSTPKATSDNAVAEVLAETPTRRPRVDNPEHNSPVNSVVDEPRIPSPHAPTLDEKDASDSQVPVETQYTQGLESQRLSLEAINAMGPQTLRSDIMVSLHPEHLTKIVDGTKNHEFRVWKIPEEVSRVWLYATKPVSELRYMCVFGPPKAPGEVDDERGAGNRAFNQGHTVNKYAYEVLQVYELNDPISLQEMLRKGWVKGAPQKYNYVPPAVVGALTANLRCALFGDGDDEIEAVGAAVTESQELRDQIQSDLTYSTQHPSSEPGHPGGERDGAEVGEEEGEIIPSSQTAQYQGTPSPKRAASGKEGGDRKRAFAKPALPKAASSSSTNTTTTTKKRGQGHDTQSQGQRRSQREMERQSSFIRPSQATTVTQMSSSPVVSPARSLRPRTHRGAGTGAGAGTRAEEPPHVIASSSPAIAERHHDGDSDTRNNSSDNHNHSLRSSQFLTRSQMLPDSLLNDETREPPPIVWDSADEQSD